MVMIWLFHDNIAEIDFVDSKRKSGFDMAPPIVAMLPGAAATGLHLVSALNMYIYKGSSSLLLEY